LREDTNTVMTVVTAGSIEDTNHCKEISLFQHFIEFLFF